MLMAAEILQHAFTAAHRELHAETNPGRTTLLSSTTAVEALASALGSVVKRAALFVRAAGEAQALPRPAAGTPELAAHCFAAAVPAVTDCLLEPAAAVLCSLLQDLQRTSAQVSSAGGNAAAAGSSSSNSGGSSSSSTQGFEQQPMQSIALLTVLLARSLVVLSDAQEAAAAAAGTTPAQLFAR
jgi:hypothetical protein